MRKIRSAITMCAVITAVTMATPPAAYADEDILCGTTVYDYGKVGLTGCIRYNYDGVPYQTEGIFSIVSPTTPSLWTACKMNIARFTDNVQTRIVTGIDCLAIAKANGGEYVTDPERFYAQSGHCYRSVVKWYGTYNGNPVGSHVNAESNSVCPL